MAALMIGFALMTALCTGYQFGRRAGTRTHAWKRRPWHQRTSRLAVGKAAAFLAILVVARRVQQRVLAERALPAVTGARDRVPRRRSRRR